MFFFLAIAVFIFFIALLGILPLIIWRTTKETSVPQQIAKTKASKKPHKQTAEAVMLSTGFIISKQQKITNIKFYVDDINMKFALIQKNHLRIYNYSDLLDFELNEDGNSIAKGKGLATAVGGLTFGLGGALVGMSGKRKSESTCNSMIIRMFVNDLQNSQIVISLISGMDVKKTSIIYTSNRDIAKDFVATLTYIQSRATVMSEIQN